MFLCLHVGECERQRVGRKREREGANENENICVVKEIF